MLCRSRDLLLKGQQAAGTLPRSSPMAPRRIRHPSKSKALLCDSDNLGPAPLLCQPKSVALLATLDVCQAGMCASFSLLQASRGVCYAEPMPPTHADHCSP